MTAFVSPSISTCIAAKMGSTPHLHQEVWPAIAAVAYLDRTNISIAGIHIGKEFAIDNTHLGWVFSAFLIGYAAFQVPAGLLVHKFGTRLVLTFAVLWWGLFILLTAIVPPGSAVLS